MFGIKPLKTLFILAILFILFMMTKIDPSKLASKVDDSNQTQAKQKSKKAQKPLPKPEDGVKILHHLFQSKIKDKAMQCRYKKAKKRFFIACKGGDVIKDNYWEFSLYKKRLRLLARSTSALYIIERYHFKELRSDKDRAYPKVEKALVAFFND